MRFRSRNKFRRRSFRRGSSSRFRRKVRGMLRGAIARRIGRRM